MSCITIYDENTRIQCLHEIKINPDNKIGQKTTFSKCLPSQPSQSDTTQPLQPIQPVQLVQHAQSMQPIPFVQPAVSTKPLKRNSNAVTPPPSPTLSTATTATGTTTPIYSMCKVVVRSRSSFQIPIRNPPKDRCIFTPSFISIWLLIKVRIAHSRSQNPSIFSPSTEHHVITLTPAYSFIFNSVTTILEGIDGACFGFLLSSTFI